MKQHTIKPALGSNKREKRLGRGKSRGNYSGRGMKGQGSRTGSGRRAAFEGGQTPLVRRMPKMKGFKNINKEIYGAINLDDLNVFSDGDTVTVETLQKRGLVKTKKVKLLARGELKIKLSLTVDKVSITAKEKFEASGGTLTLSPEKIKPVKN